jgi:hypothetical protein
VITLIRKNRSWLNDLSSENGSDVDSGLVGTSQERPPGQLGEMVPEVSGAEQTAQAGAPSGEGRRTQLRIVRENIDSLSRDVGSFRKSHEVSVKSLEKQLTSLRKELAARARATETGGLSKDYESSAKRMEKQVTTLRNELSALKIGIAKDAAKSRAKQEATLSKILAKVSAKTKSAKRSTKR